MGFLFVGWWLDLNMITSNKADEILDKIFNGNLKRVPRNFWEHHTNQQNALIWLCKKLNLNFPLVGFTGGIFCFGNKNLSIIHKIILL